MKSLGDAQNCSLRPMDTLLTIQTLDLVEADLVVDLKVSGGFDDLAVVETLLVDSKISLVVSFGGGASCADRANMPRQGADLQYVMDLTFEEATFGKEENDSLSSVVTNVKLVMVLVLNQVLILQHVLNVMVQV